jgi:hypothetical protein
MGKFLCEFSHEGEPPLRHHTNAPGNYSNHQFGLAIDIVPMVNGKEDWSESGFLKIGPIAKTISENLKWGHFFPAFPDNPHYQDLMGHSQSYFRKLPKDSNHLPILPASSGN